MQEVKIDDKYDKEFISLVLEIEKKCTEMCKHDKLKIDSWVRNLCIPTSNLVWKKNRNLHAILLLDMIINGKLEEPYNKFCNQFEDVQTVSKSTVQCRLSSKFFKVVSLASTERDVNEFIETHLIQKTASTPKLKLNKLILKPKKVIMSSHDIPPRNKSARVKLKISPSDDLLSRKYMNRNFITKNKLISSEYQYEKDYGKLKRLIKSLEEERALKDEIIMRQNQEKKKIMLRIEDLEMKLDQLNQVAR